MKVGSTTTYHVWNILHVWILSSLRYHITVTEFLMDVNFDGYWVALQQNKPIDFISPHII